MIGRILLSERYSLAHLVCCSVTSTPVLLHTKYEVVWKRSASNEEHIASYNSFIYYIMEECGFFFANYRVDVWLKPSHKAPG